MIKQSSWNKLLYLWVFLIVIDGSHCQAKSCEELGRIRRYCYSVDFGDGDDRYGCIIAYS